MVVGAPDGLAVAIGRAHLAAMVAGPRRLSCLIAQYWLQIALELLRGPTTSGHPKIHPGIAANESVRLARIGEESTMHLEQQLKPAACPKSLSSLLNALATWRPSQSIHWDGWQSGDW